MAKSILIIDDYRDMLVLQKTVLDMEGYQTFTAQTAEDAFQIISENPALDLILLDYNLTTLNGLEFLELLKENFQEVYHNVPIVFMTGMPEVPPSIAKGFIRKGLDLDELVKKVGQYINKVDSSVAPAP